MYIVLHTDGTANEYTMEDMPDGMVWLAGMAKSHFWVEAVVYCSVVAE